MIILELNHGSGIRTHIEYSYTLHFIERKEMLDKVGQFLETEDKFFLLNPLLLLVLFFFFHFSSKKTKTRKVENTHSH